MKDHGNKLGMVTAAASLAMAAGLASAQCQTATGADVIVGNIINGTDFEINTQAGSNPVNLANYTSFGGLDATSLGTTSCNVGTVNLNWIASTNQHPVIGGNLFQYREFGNYATLEQVGMSWLKHGFTALTQSLCCSCNGQGGSRLGVGCSDPYTSSRNGGQTSAGPRWQVNASTGFFNYPPPNTSVSGSTARRLEFQISDIVASNTAPFNSGTAVRHFGEAQYVTPDDAAAGNKFNNSSFRRVIMTGTGNPVTNWNAAISNVSPGNGIAAMQRQKSAVEVWPQIDNQVLQDTIIVPNATPIASDPYKGEGKFIVSSRAYDLGDGTWRYEYSIHNQCSHRSAGSFEIPVPAGVNVTNVGFHCPVYRNGDGDGSINFSSTPWASDTTGGKVGWATQPFNVNIRANAIRWGTTYNFRFIADTAPVSGTSTVGLWRPAAAGEPTNFSARVMVPSAPTGNPCLADWDGDDTVGVPDIFAFLADWFADDPAAQTFGGGTGGVGAIFAFLSEWFAHGTGPC